MIVNAATGDASLKETIDDCYQPSNSITIPVTRARGQSSSGTCDACSEDDEFAEWAEDAEHWDVSALSDEILSKLINAGVTDSTVAAWDTEE